VRRTASEKMEIIRLVEGTDLPVRATLRQMNIPRSTFYGWYQRYIRSATCRAISRRRQQAPRNGFEISLSGSSCVFSKSGTPRDCVSVLTIHPQGLGPICGVDQPTDRPVRARGQRAARKGANMPRSEPDCHMRTYRRCRKRCLK
jgi:hypothetical protein